jgi:outer membrane lipoprotein carrier protein
MKKIQYILALMLFASMVHAGQGMDMLEGFLAGTHSLEARFQQKLLDNKGVLLQQSAGKLILKRPGKFIWDYKIPYPQKIVSNGKRIWIYDSELQQVTIKPYDQMLAGTPVILLDKQKNLAEDFIVTEAEALQEQYWVKLVPRGKENEFREIYVAMYKGNLKAMRLLDNFNQSTTIEFEQMQTNLAVDDEQFTFVPPKGADVIGDF